MEAASPTVPERENASGERRVALVVSKRLDPGAAANVAALLMGQLVIDDGSLYAPDAVAGADGLRHVAIRHSTVILRAGPGQLATLAATARPPVSCCVFTELGQGLHDRFAEYQARLQQEDTAVVGVGLSGDAEQVRALTRKFSVL